MDFTEADFDNLLLKYKVNDTETLKAELEVKKLQITLAGDAYDKGLITKNEARAILGMPPVDDGDEFKQPAANPLEGPMLDGGFGGQGQQGQKPPQKGKEEEEGKEGEEKEGKEKQQKPKPGEQSQMFSYMTDEELHNQIHHHEGDAARSALAPVELGLETSLIQEYNQAVKSFADGAIEILQSMDGSGPEEPGPDEGPDAGVQKVKRPRSKKAKQ